MIMDLYPVRAIKNCVAEQCKGLEAMLLFCQIGAVGKAYPRVYFPKGVLKVNRKNLYCEQYKIKRHKEEYI